MTGADPTPLPTLSHARTLPDAATNDLSSGTGAILDPQSIGRFRVLARVGAGGMGVVFAAYDVDLDRKIAVKLVAGAAQGAAQDRLLREAQAMARLSHPNVAQVYEVGTHHGQVYIAMEFVRGASLGHWLAAAPRGWRDVLAVFAQAGRGLQAAHDAGLVHRDFKPDNVMVAEDGRAVVLDFGIAHTRGADADLAGTPAYMSPEQWRGEHVLPASDQYNFCAALFEALYGRLPREGEAGAGSGGPTPTRLPTATARGGPASAAADPRLPRRIRRAIARGLSPAPEARFPSMSALLAELAPPAARPWRWLAAGALAFGTAAAVALARHDPAAACALAAAPLGEVWGPSQRLAVLQALSSGTATRADAPRLVTRLDAYARGWAGQARAACEATLVRREASEARLDRRMSCLDGRLRVLRALTHELAAGITARSLDAIEALPPLADCADEAFLAARVPPPPPALAGPVAEARQRLAESRAKELLYVLPAARAISQEVAAYADDLGYPPLAAEAQLQLGRQQAGLGELGPASTAFTRAFHLALAHGDDSTALEAALGAAAILNPDADARTIDRWDQLAEDLLLRTGSPEFMRIALIYRRGINACVERRCDDAIERLEPILTARAARLGADDPEGTKLLLKLASLAMVRDDVARAETYYRRALAGRERELGPDHPQLGALLVNLSELARRGGRVDEAEALAARALPLVEISYGASHPFVARLLHLRGDLAARRGDLDAAERLLRRALAIHLDRLGASATATGDSMTALARLRLRAGDPGGAAVHANAALALAQAPDSLLDPDTTAERYALVAEIEVARGRLDLAADVARRGLAAVRGLDGVRLYTLDIALGEALLGLGQLQQARTALEQGLAGLARHAGRAYPEDWARLRFALARALVEFDPARAAALAAAARADFERAGPFFAARAAEATAWLAHRDRP